MLARMVQFMMRETRPPELGRRLKSVSLWPPLGTSTVRHWADPTGRLTCVWNRREIVFASSCGPSGTVFASRWRTGGAKTPGRPPKPVFLRRVRPPAAASPREAPKPLFASILEPQGAFSDRSGPRIRIFASSFGVPAFFRSKRSVRKCSALAGTLRNGRRRFSRRCGRGVAAVCERRPIRGRNAA